MGGARLWESQFISKRLFRRPQKGKRTEIVEEYHTKKGNSGRIPHKEKKFWEDTTQRKETIDGGGTLAQSRRKERIMKAWAQKANVAFCTIFFFYQVFPKIIFREAIL